MPLLANELMWGAGQAVLLQCYSVRGIQAVAALNICNTIAQIFNEVFLSLGNATAIVVGQELGADRLTGARRTAWRMITLSLASCVIMGAALAVCAPFIPRIYNTEEPIPPACDRADPHGGAVYAAVRLCQLRVFHAALRRQNVHHIFV